MVSGDPFSSFCRGVVIHFEEGKRVAKLGRFRLDRSSYTHSRKFIEGWELALDCRSEAAYIWQVISLSNLDRSTYKINTNVSLQTEI